MTRKLPKETVILNDYNRVIQAIAETYSSKSYTNTIAHRRLAYAVMAKCIGKNGSRIVKNGSGISDKVLEKGVLELKEGRFISHAEFHEKFPTIQKEIQEQEAEERKELARLKKARLEAERAKERSEKINGKKMARLKRSDSVVTVMVPIEKRYPELREQINLICDKYEEAHKGDLGFRGFSALSVTRVLGELDFRFHVTFPTKEKLALSAYIQHILKVKRIELDHAPMSEEEFKELMGKKKSYLESDSARKVTFASDGLSKEMIPIKDALMSIIQRLSGTSEFTLKNIANLLSYGRPQKIYYNTVNVLMKRIGCVRVPFYKKFDENNFSDRVILAHKKQVEDLEVSYPGILEASRKLLSEFGEEIRNSEDGTARMNAIGYPIKTEDFIALASYLMYRRVYKAVFGSEKIEEFNEMNESRLSMREEKILEKERAKERKKVEKGKKLLASLPDSSSFGVQVDMEIFRNDEPSENENQTELPSDPKKAIKMIDKEIERIVSAKSFIDFFEKEPMEEKEARLSKMVAYVMERVEKIYSEEQDFRKRLITLSILASVCRIQKIPEYRKFVARSTGGRYTAMDVEDGIHLLIRRSHSC